MPAAASYRNRHLSNTTLINVPNIKILRSIYTLFSPELYNTWDHRLVSLVSPRHLRRYLTRHIPRCNLNAKTRLCQFRPYTPHKNAIHVVWILLARRTGPKVIQVSILVPVTLAMECETSSLALQRLHRGCEPLGDVVAVFRGVVGVVVGSAGIFEQIPTRRSCEVRESGVGTVCGIVRQSARGGVDVDLVARRPGRVETGGRVRIDYDGGCVGGEVAVCTFWAGQADCRVIDVEAPARSGDERVFDWDVWGFARSVQEQSWGMVWYAREETPDMEDMEEGQGRCDDREQGQQSYCFQHCLSSWTFVWYKIPNELPRKYRNAFENYSIGNRSSSWRKNVYHTYDLLDRQKFQELAEE